LLLGSAVLVLPAQESQSAPSKTEGRYQESFAMPAGGRLSVQNYKGAVVIEGWDKNQLVVDVFKHYEGDSSLRDQWLRETRVASEVSGSSARIEVEYPKHFCAFGCDENMYGWVELQLHAPRATNLEIDGYKPEIKIADLAGTIGIHTYKAPIDIRSSSNTVRINTYKSDIRIQADRLGDGIEIENYKSDAELALPAGTAMTVEFKGERKAEFNSEFELAAEGSFRGNHVHGTVNGGGPMVRFTTYKGSLRLRKRGSGL